MDSEGTIVNANLMLKSMFGYRQGELVGKSIDILLPEGIRSRRTCGTSREAI